MSVVTTIMLSLGPLESPGNLDRFHTLLLEHRIGVLGDLTEDFSNAAERGVRWGGTKYPAVELYGAAYNHLNLSTFMDLMLSIPWEEPQDLQLFVCEHHEQKFNVYEIVDGRWVMLTRPSG